MARIKLELEISTELANEAAYLGIDAAEVCTKAAREALAGECHKKAVARETGELDTANQETRRVAASVKRWKCGGKDTI
ncbi:MAG: hypothetical protein WBG50_02210 [Desulfomonilaceae bacterium]